MPQILLTWLLISLAAVFWGGLAQNWFRFVFPERKNASLWLQFWTGLAIFSLLLSLFTFFLPLGSELKLILWIFILMFPVIWRRDMVFVRVSLIKKSLLKLHPVAWILFFLTSLTGLLKSTGNPEIFDEGAYHLPLIRMWEQQGLVVGIANLNGHYGLHSVWHILSAFTSLDFIPGFRSEMCLNGLLASLIGLFAASRLNLILRKNEPLKLSYFIACLLPVFLFRNLLSSPSTDIPAIAGCWFFFLLWLEAMEKDEKLQNQPDLFVLLPVWIVTVKSSSAGLLTAVLFFLGFLWVNNAKRAFLFSVGLALIPALLWVFQNWLISGYAVFPVEISAIGHPEWQVPHESIQKKFYLEQFGTFAPPESYTLSWLKTWFFAHNPDSRVIILLAVLFFILAPFVFGRREKESLSKTGFYLLLLLQTGIWFFTITEPRYGFGALVIAALLLPAIFFQKMAGKQPFFRNLLLLILPLLAFSSFRTLKEYREQNQSILVPAPVPQVKFRKIHCGNFEASMPVSYSSVVPEGKPVFCWDCPYPCFPLEGVSDSSHVFIENNSPVPYFYFQNLKTGNSKSH